MSTFTGRRAASRPAWTNWSRLVTAEPLRRVAPRDAGEVALTVQGAAAAGLRVKAVGAGHSFTSIAQAPDVLLDVRHLDRVQALDAGTGLVTVGAGLTLHGLSPWLWQAGLALTTLGDIDRQTVAGAISTGTHGSGLAYGSVAAAVRGLQIVLADGNLVSCSAAERPELFAAATVGLGAYGVVTAVTLQCEPAFWLRARERSEPLSLVLAELGERIAGRNHFEFFWFPHTDLALVRANERLSAAPDGERLPRWRALLDDELLANGVLGGVCRLDSRAPRVIPAVNRLCARLYSDRGYVDRSYRVFASTRRVRFHESEWAVPVAATTDVLRAIGNWLARPGNEIGFPLEVRFGAAEEAWLSPAYGRPTAWISAQTHHTQHRPDYLRRVGEICRAHDGRPHWAKLHELHAPELAERYPRFADAIAVRDAVDPDRRFANGYLDRVLGR